MIAMGTLKIRTRWLERGYFTLWSEPYMAAQELIRVLFAYHTPSYYGTFIRTESLGFQEEIILPAHWALDYWIERPVIEHASLEWGEEAARYTQIAYQIQRVLENGHLVPDYHAWLNGAVGWRISWMELENRDGQEIQAQRMDDWSFEDQNLAERWLSAVLQQELVDARQAALPERTLRIEKSLYERVKHSYDKLQQLQPSDWLNEDDWLLVLGWEQDPAPFELSLQLVEPGPSDSWALRFLVQSVTEPRITGECAVDGEGLSEYFPPEWQPKLTDFLLRETRRITRIVTSLADPKQPGRLLQELNDDQAWRFLTEWSSELLALGVHVMLPAWWEQVRRARPSLRTAIHSPITRYGEGMLGLDQLLQFDWQVAIGGLALTKEEYQLIAKEQKKLANIRGQWVAVDQILLQNIQKKLNKYVRDGGIPLRDVLEHGLFQHHRSMDEAESLTEAGDVSFVMEMEFREDAKQFLNQLQRIHKPPLISVPTSFEGQLRLYQHEGVSWLAMLRRLGFGGCLADDMGLGKTVQWIAYLLLMKETEVSDQPSLLICPTSVLGNWQIEFERFAPQLRVYLHHGPTRLSGEEFREAVASSDVVLTSYTLANLDQEELVAITWDSICLDEAQNIKNAHTKQSQAIQQLKAHHRVAMTGTPIENRLAELWSIMNFVNPGVLGSLSAFERRARLIEKHQDEAATKRLQALVRPFLLRRVKEDPTISLDLPDKEELKCYVTLTAEQSAMYEEHLDGLFRRIDKLYTMERRGTVLSTIMKLKQLCDHPALLENTQPQSVEALLEGSNKLQRLVEMVQEVRETGEKCIIFTQFINMGKLLQHVLETILQEDIPFMHGGISKNARDQMISDFQHNTASSAGGVFILSLKTGGIGLNLTAANHVFHYDRWWNPAIENQASDRVYRIGQDKNVFVHKFISIGTLEEKIDRMLERKIGLSKQIVGNGEQWISELSNEELRELLELRR